MRIHGAQEPAHSHLHWLLGGHTYSHIRVHDHSSMQACMLKHTRFRGSSHSCLQAPPFQPPFPGIDIWVRNPSPVCFPVAPISAALALLSSHWCVSASAPGTQTTTHWLLSLPGHQLSSRSYLSWCFSSHGLRLVIGGVCCSLRLLISFWSMTFSLPEACFKEH